MGARVRIKKVSKKGAKRPGDMLMDFLVVAGVLPPDFFSSLLRALPPEAIAACRRLIDWLRVHPDAWLEVPPAMGDMCRLVVDDKEVPVNRLNRLPGVEDYPWHKRGPLWYCSDAKINYMYSGPVIFMRDGWVGVDPQHRSRLTLISWSRFDSPQWPGVLPDGDEEEREDVLNLDTNLVVTADDLGWNELTLELASVLLPRVIAAQGADGRSLTTPPIGQWSPELIRSIMVPDKGVK